MDPGLDWGLFDFALDGPSGPDAAVDGGADADAVTTQRYYAPTRLTEARKLALNAVLFTGDTSPGGAVRRVLFATIQWRADDWFHVKSEAALRRFWAAFGRSPVTRAAGEQLTPEALSLALAANERDYDQMTQHVAYLEERSFAYVIVRTAVTVDLNAVAGALAAVRGHPAAAPASSWWSALFQKPVEHTLVEYTLVVDFALTRAHRSKTQRLLAMRSAYMLSNIKQQQQQHVSTAKPHMSSPDSHSASGASSSGERTRTTATLSGSGGGGGGAAHGMVRVEPKHVQVTAVVAAAPSAPAATTTTPAALPGALRRGTSSASHDDSDSDSDSGADSSSSSSSSNSDDGKEPAAALARSTGRDERQTLPPSPPPDTANRKSYIDFRLSRSTSSSGSGSKRRK